MKDIDLYLLLEMNKKAQKLCELMKKGIVEFEFEKASTGKNRKAHGTLKRDLIPAEAQRKRGRPRKRPDYLVIYYDIDKHDIRSFRDYLLGDILSKPKDPTLDEQEKPISKPKRRKHKKKHSAKSV